MTISPAVANGAAVVVHRGDARERGQRARAAAGPVPVGAGGAPAPGVGRQRAGHGAAVLLHAAHARGLPGRHGRPHGLHQRGGRQPRRRHRARRHRRPGTLIASK